MQDPSNSIHFLWAAYIVVAVAQTGYAGWLALRWSRLKR